MSHATYIKEEHRNLVVIKKSSCEPQLMTNKSSSRKQLWPKFPYKNQL